MRRSYRREEYTAARSDCGITLQKLSSINKGTQTKEAFSVYIDRDSSGLNAKDTRLALLYTP